MDRQDYTRDWYQKQDFRSPDEIEMRNVRGARPVHGRAYPPSDLGDYRRPGHEEPSPDYIHAGRHIDKRYIPMPGIAIARTRNSFAGISENQRNQPNGITNRGYGMREGFDNGGFVPNSDPRYSDPPRNPSEGRPPNPGSKLPESAYIMYNGSKYLPTESNYYSEPGARKERPSWVTKAIPYDREEKDEKHKTPVCTTYVIARLIVILCIVWDLCMDWMVVSSGERNSYFTFDPTNDGTLKCGINYQVFIAFGNDSAATNASQYLCNENNVSDVWKAFVAFSLIGSLLAIIQIINIGCEMISVCKPGVFQVLHGQSEVLLVLFFEEIPQIGMTLSFFSICKCDNGQTVALYGLLSVLSAAISTTARYTTSFQGLTTHNGGCCNTWWRCACCKNPKYFCRVKPREVCCTCNVPCPLCCCTLYCSSCKWSPQSWCAPLLKAFSCFCDCCQTDDEMYGIRMVNNLGMLILWFCASFQIAIYVISYA